MTTAWTLVGTRAARDRHMCDAVNIWWRSRCRPCCSKAWETRLKGPAAPRPPPALARGLPPTAQCSPLCLTGDVISPEPYSAASRVPVAGLAICRAAADNRWDGSFKTWTNLPKCGRLPSSLRRRCVQRLRPVSKPTDLKAKLITVVLAFRYKTPKSWKEFWVLLQTWKQAKAREEVP